jgi:tripartite-type tricarboxylate transporter receptor subunit TctC
MKIHNRFTGFLIAGAALIASPLPAHAGYYDGKTVKVIIGLAPGGTVDTLTRAFTGVWEKHLGGKPQFVVENMPGGGGTRALNYVFKAKPDGLTILFGPWGPITEVLGEEMLQAKHGKYEYIGGLTDLRVSYVRTDIVPGGMKKASDIMKAQSIKVGGNNATGISDLMARMTFDVLGVKYGYVTGFAGGSEIYAALKRDEVQAHNTSISSFRQRSGSGVDAGEFMGVAYATYVSADGTYSNNKEITEMPSFPDLYKEVHGKMPSGPRWDAFNWFTGLVGDMAYVSFAPPGTPKAVVEELRTAFSKGCADKEFVGPLIKRFGIAHDCVNLQEGTRIIKSIDSVDPKILATFKQTIKEGEK